MTLKDLIAADSVRVMFQTDEYAEDLGTYTSVDQAVGGSDTTFANVLGIVDPAIDRDVDTMIETAIDIAILDGTVTRVDLTTAAVGVFTLGETVTGGTSGATGSFVAFIGGTDAILLANVVGTFTAGETLTGGSSSSTAVVHLTTPGQRLVGVPSPKAGDFLNAFRGYRWTVDRVLREPERRTHTVVLVRGAASP